MPPEYCDGATGANHLIEPFDRTAVAQDATEQFIRLSPEDQGGARLYVASLNLAAHGWPVVEFRTAKSDIRNPSSERNLNPKTEGLGRRRPQRNTFHGKWGQHISTLGFRASHFGLLSGFEDSDFGIQADPTVFHSRSIRTLLTTLTKLGL